MLYVKTHWARQQLCAASKKNDGRPTVGFVFVCVGRHCHWPSSRIHQQKLVPCSIKKYFFNALSIALHLLCLLNRTAFCFGGVYTHYANILQDCVQCTVCCGILCAHGLPPCRAAHESANGWQPTKAIVSLSALPGRELSERSLRNAHYKFVGQFVADRRSTADIFALLCLLYFTQQQRIFNLEKNFFFIRTKNSIGYRKHICMT